MHELSGILPPAQDRGLADGIRQSLREAIVGGVLRPGFRLREIPLAQHFNCSTTPVREALRQLENEGLVKVHARRGAEVVSIGVDTLSNLFEARLLLEAPAVGLAAQRHPSKASLADARRLLQESKQLRGPDDFVRLQSLDVEFHRQICALSGNPMLAELVERLARQIQMVRVRADARVSGGPRQAYLQHQSIVAAVEKGDAGRAKALTEQHIRWAREAVLIGSAAIGADPIGDSRSSEA